MINETDVQLVVTGNNNTPDGVIIDGDTVLQNIMEQADFEETGISNEIMQVWLDSNDKDSIEKLFNVFTGCTFRAYVDASLLALESNLQNEENNIELE